LAQTFRVRPNNFDKWNDCDFRNRFRVPKDVVRFIIEEIHDEISSKTDKNHALSPSDMVFITLRYLATGAMGQLIGDSNGVDKATVSRAIPKVINAIARRRAEFINMPDNEQAKNKIKQSFFNISKFPRCVGAVDCTHVKIQSPGGNDAEIYRNRKGYFSFNVQGICDANLKILDLVCRWPGSAHDCNIFKNSRLRHRFENGDFGNDLLVGDGGYGIKPYLITPLLNPTTPEQQLFNEAQIRTRNPIERCFGVLKRRFAVLALGIRLSIEKVELLVIASAILHNIACMLNDTEAPETNEEIEAAIALTENVNENLVENNNLNDNRNNEVRNTLIHYFSTLEY
jgi:hypothetical protein